MENALLIGLSRQAALQNQIDVVANNLANLNTAGYKRESLLFQQYVNAEAEVDQQIGAGRDINYVIDAGTVRDFAEGALESTGNPLDVAIFGKGWFVVDTPEGQRYTRNGQFTLDANGQLVTSQGFPVQGNGGGLTFGPDETDIQISSDGTVSTSLGQKGALQVVNFTDENALRKEGATLYSADAAPTPATGTRVTQGVYERSNVEAVTEMTRMISVMRSYTSTARLLENIGELNSTAIRELGRVPTA